MCLVENDKLVTWGHFALVSVVRQLEERRRREAQAYRMAHLNRGLGREGRAFVP